MADATRPNPTAIEDILASIKRVMAEPDNGGDRAVASRDQPVVHAHDDVLELGAPPRPEGLEGAAVTPAGPATVSADVPPRPAAPARTSSLCWNTADPRRLEESAPPAPIVSRETLAALPIDPEAPAGTLDALVRDLLRPMLKEWLDAHLPDLVERALAAEVNRRGQGSI